MGFLRNLFSKPEPPRPDGALPQSDLGRQLAANRQAQATAEKAGIVRGKHYTEWIPDLNEMRSAGESRQEEYLALLLEIIGACERASAALGQIPAPGYTKRAAIVYRRRKDYAAEAEIITRYNQSCLDNTGGQLHAGDDLLERLSKAKTAGSRPEGPKS